MKLKKAEKRMSAIKKIVKKNRCLVSCYILIGFAISFINSFNANYYQVLIDKFTEKSLQGKDIAIYAGALLLWCILGYIDEYPVN